MSSPNAVGDGAVIGVVFGAFENVKADALRSRGHVLVRSCANQARASCTVPKCLASDWGRE